MVRIRNTLQARRRKPNGLDVDFFATLLLALEESVVTGELGYTYASPIGSGARHLRDAFSSPKPLASSLAAAGTFSKLSVAVMNFCHSIDAQR
jgi:hypothetical protein